MTTSEARECYVKIEREPKFGKPYVQWKFMGWYVPTGKYIKSNAKFDYYETPTGIEKYRK